VSGRGEPAPRSAALARRYRRLLAWYPAGQRSVYGDEMLGVLMAAASGRGTSRPGAAETLNLIWSGLGARIQAIGTAPIRPGATHWRSTAWRRRSWSPLRSTRPRGC